MKYILAYKETEKGNTVYREFKSMYEVNHYVEQIVTYDGYKVYELIYEVK